MSGLEIFGELQETTTQFLIARDLVAQGSVWGRFKTRWGTRTREWGASKAGTGRDLSKGGGEGGSRAWDSGAGAEARQGQEGEGVILKPKITVRQSSQQRGQTSCFAACPSKRSSPGSYSKAGMPGYAWRCWGNAKIRRTFFSGQRGLTNKGGGSGCGRADGVRVLCCVVLGGRAGCSWVSG